MKKLLLALTAITTFQLSFGQALSTYEPYKIEIKNQLNKAYSAFTATINGSTYTPIEKMPLYNIQQNDKNTYLTEVKKLSIKMSVPHNQSKFQVKNIDVYKFIDRNTAQVRYNLIVTIILGSNSYSDSMHINLIAKKVNGNWKFDATKFFGGKEEWNKDNISNADNSDKLIDKKLLENPKQTASQVVQIIETNSNNSDTTLTDESNCYLFFYHEKMYVILNGDVINVWHMTKAHQVDELTVYNTREGENIALDFMDVYVDYKSGKSVQYGCEPPDVPLDKIFIRPQFLK